MRHIRLPVVWVAVIGFLFAGCGPRPIIDLRYDRSAEYMIAPSIRSLGIAEFGGKTAEDRKWGEIASDRLAAKLDAYNRMYNRYTLVDRKRLKAILDERDLQAAFSDSSQAVEAGKVAKVDAMIYGNVNVSSRDEPASKTTFDPIHQRLKTITYTRRYVMAEVNFTIDNVQTGKALATVSAVRQFDSDKDRASGSKSITSMMGFSGGSLPPAEKIIPELIDECVDQFVEKISPHQVTAQERLRGGKSKAVATGNKLAKAGDYAEALEMYQAAIAAKPDDHGAIFNAGVVCEALGKLDKAEQYYDRAFRIKPEEQYILARKRVRVESTAGGKEPETLP